MPTTETFRRWLDATIRCNRLWPFIEQASVSGRTVLANNTNMLALCKRAISGAVCLIADISFYVYLEHWRVSPDMVDMDGSLSSALDLIKVCVSQPLKR